MNFLLLPCENKYMMMMMIKAPKFSHTTFILKSLHWLIGE